MKYCPLMSFRKECVSEIYCRGENCAWWDNRTKQCLIATALKQYVAGGKIIMPTADTKIDLDWGDQ